MRTLLLSATGGHLQELWELRPRLVPTSDYVWAVPANPQSESLLAREEWVSIPYIGARDWRSMVAALPSARRTLSELSLQRVVTTGGSVVTPYLLAAASLGIPRHYIETAARTIAPSLTGRFAAANPGTHLYSQYRGWPSKWKYRGGVFDGFEPRPRIRRQEALDGLSVVVTLGTEPFAFDRAVAAVRNAVPSSARVTWQVGPATSTSGLTDVHVLLPERDLLRRIDSADVVVAHAGVGSALAALKAGKLPVLLPRKARFGEVADDHQYAIAGELRSRGLAIAVEPEDLSVSHLEAAAESCVRPTTEAKPFFLG